MSIICKYDTLWQLLSSQFVIIFSDFPSSSVKKILTLRLFDDAAGKRWSRSIKDDQLEILCVSQFTLYGRVNKNKPDFHQAMQGAEAFALYNLLLKQLSDSYAPEKIKGSTSKHGVSGEARKLTISLLISIVFCRWQIWRLHAGAHSKRWTSDYWNWFTQTAGDNDKLKYHRIK